MSLVYNMDHSDTDLSHLDLCTGIGAFSLAAEQVGGFRPTYLAEYEPNAAEVLSRHFRARNLGDVTKIEGDWLRDFIGIDVLTAGFPCTDLSRCGKGSHKDLEGEASGLFWDILEIIRYTGPRWVVFENVRQVLKYLKLMEDEMIFYEVKGELFHAEELGCKCRRPRAFVIGCSRVGGAQKVLDHVNSCRTPKESRPKDTLPMLLPWKGGVSLERLGSCVVEDPADPETHPTRIREVPGLPRGMDFADGARYLMLGNSIPVPMAQVVMEGVRLAEEWIQQTEPMEVG
jgi:hypothetical protein